MNPSESRRTAAWRWAKWGLLTWGGSVLSLRLAAVSCSDRAGVAAVCGVVTLFGLGLGWFEGWLWGRCRRRDGTALVVGAVVRLAMQPIGFAEFIIGFAAISLVRAASSVPIEDPLTWPEAAGAAVIAGVLHIGLAWCVGSVCCSVYDLFRDGDPHTKSTISRSPSSEP